ncbi:omptin family outer membrane protease [Erwinia piriflorinigrans]|nr:omptin family outer membrane protease [Erwinia piriflorinigrans]
MMRLKIRAIVLFAPMAFTAVANAENAFFTPEKVSVDMGLGSLSGESKMHVYDPQIGGQKIYQANWKYNNAAILKGSLDWDLMPWVSVGAAGWTTIASRGGNRHSSLQEDARVGQLATEYDNPTPLNYANQFDLNIKGWLLNEPDYRLGVMAGYQESRYSFTSFGNFTGYIDQDTGLPVYNPVHDVALNGYKQRSKIPYVGLTGSYRYQRFEFGATFKYSGWVQSNDREESYFQEHTSTGKVNSQKYYSLAANAGYYVTPNAMLYLEGIWNRTTNKIGNRITDNRPEGTTVVDDFSRGIENSSFMTSIGLKYTF